jgi:hypothetical protein
MPGRVAPAKAERLEVPLVVRLTPSLNERLRREANGRAVNIGEVTRRLLTRQVEAWEAEPIERTIAAV